MLRIANFRNTFASVSLTGKSSVQFNNNLTSVRFRSKLRPLRYKNGIIKEADKSYYDEEYTKDTEYTEQEIDQKREKMDNFLKNIDTTLTPEQRVHVEKLKKQMKGGPKSPRSLYRDVPRPEEITADGNFLTKMAPNAEALIDYALSKIPPRAGPRRSRRKKRMLIKHTNMRAQAKQRKQETQDAMYNKQAKSKRQRILCSMYKDFAKTENAIYKKDTVFSDFALMTTQGKVKDYFKVKRGLAN